MPEWLLPDKSFIHPRWDQIHTWVAGHHEALHNAIWMGIAQDWLLRLASQFGADYRVFSSRHFFVVGPVTAGDGEARTKTCETLLQRIRAALGAMALPEWLGKFVVVLAPDLDTLLRYLADYHTDGDHMLPAGYFLDLGYGHVLMQRGIDFYSSNVLAHELCHAQLCHLPLPLWLNEAVTMGVEHTVLGTRPQLLEDELHEYFAYWTPERIPDFWSGQSFDHAHNGSKHSYTLARELLAHFIRIDRKKIPQVVLHAQYGDSAFATFRQSFGLSPADALTKMLGPGDWSDGHIQRCDSNQPC